MESATPVIAFVTRIVRIEYRRLDIKSPIFVAGAFTNPPWKLQKMIVPDEQTVSDQTVRRKRHPLPKRFRDGSRIVPI
jgi:hypothetical protein